MPSPHPMAMPAASGAQHRADGDNKRRAGARHRGKQGDVEGDDVLGLHVGVWIRGCGVEKCVHIGTSSGSSPVCYRTDLRKPPCQARLAAFEKPDAGRGETFVVGVEIVGLQEQEHTPAGLVANGSLLRAVGLPAAGSSAPVVGRSSTQRLPASSGVSSTKREAQLADIERDAGIIIRNQQRNGETDRDMAAFPIRIGGSDTTKKLLTVQAPASSDARNTCMRAHGQARSDRKTLALRVLLKRLRRCPELLLPLGHDPAGTTVFTRIQCSPRSRAMVRVRPWRRTLRWCRRGSRLVPPTSCWSRD